MYVTPKPLEPTEIIGGCIAVYKNAWSNPLETIKILERVTSNKDFPVPFTPAQTLGEEARGVSTQSIRTNYNLALHDAGRHNDELREINNKFFELCLGSSIWYSQHFGFDPHVYINEVFQVLRYSGGQHYEAHFDGSTETGRCISPILYLNSDYTGGEIEFVNYNIKIKPESGMFLLFPASFPYRHIAHPVETGTKYAIVTWLHDRPSGAY